MNIVPVPFGQKQDGGGKAEDLGYELTVDFTGKSGTAYRYWSVDNPTAAGLLAAEGNYALREAAPRQHLFTALLRRRR